MVQRRPQQESETKHPLDNVGPFGFFSPLARSFRDDDGDSTMEVERYYFDNVVQGRSRVLQATICNMVIRRRPTGKVWWLELSRGSIDEAGKN